MSGVRSVCRRVVWLGVGAVHSQPLQVEPSLWPPSPRGANVGRAGLGFLAKGKLWLKGFYRDTTVKTQENGGHLSKSIEKPPTANCLDGKGGNATDAESKPTCNPFKSPSFLFS